MSDRDKSAIAPLAYVLMSLVWPPLLVYVPADSYGGLAALWIVLCLTAIIGDLNAPHGRMSRLWLAAVFSVLVVGAILSVEAFLLDNVSLTVALMLLSICVVAAALYFLVSRPRLRPRFAHSSDS